MRITSLFRWAGQYLAIIALLLLSACATNAPIVVPPLATSAVPPEKGVFSLLVTDNSGGTRYDTLTVQTENPLGESSKRTEYVISSTLLPGSSDVLLFSGSLPAGKYSLKEFTKRTGNMLYWLRFDDKNKHQFTVNPGTVTDLGRLIETNLNDQQLIFVRAVNETSSYQYVAMAMPETAKHLNVTHPNTVPGWDVINDKGEALRYQIAKITARDFNSPTLFSDGSVAGGTRLGGALLRTAEGKWKRFDTQTNHTVQAVAELPDGRMFAGTEMVNLFVIDSDNFARKFSNDGLPYGQILFARYYENQGLILAILNETGLSIYSARSLSNPSWVLVESIRQTNNFWLEKAVIRAAGNRASIFVSRGDELFTYHVEQHRWATTKLPFPVLKLAAYEDKLVARGDGLLSSKSYVSPDFGGNWVETNTRSSDSLVQFAPNGDAYVFSSDDGGIIKYSADGGKSWFLYDKLSDKKLPLKTNAAAEVFLIKGETILFTDIGNNGSGTAIFGYDIKSKDLKIEHYMSIPLILNYLQKRQPEAPTPSALP